MPLDLDTANAGFCQQCVERAFIQPHRHVGQVPKLSEGLRVEALQLHLELALHGGDAGCTGGGARRLAGGGHALRIEAQPHHDGDLAVPSHPFDEISAVALVKGTVAIAGGLRHALRPDLSSDAEQQPDQQPSQDRLRGRRHGEPSSVTRATSGVDALPTAPQRFDTENDPCLPVRKAPAEFSPAPWTEFFSSG
jgi:hypothetical protein